MPVADQAYAVILDRATSREVTNLSLLDLAGDEAGEVFQVEDGTPVEELAIPAIYSFDGYWGHFIPEIQAIEERLEADKWVLGEFAAAEVDYAGQLAELEGVLQQIYRQRFTEAWTGLLSSLSVRPLAAEGGLEVLDAASSEASPIFQLARSIERHTRMDRLYDEALAAAETAEPGTFEADEFAEGVGSEELRTLYNGSAAVRGILQDFIADAAKDGGRIGGGGAGGPQEAAERLSERHGELACAPPGGARRAAHRPDPQLPSGVYDIRYQSEMDPAATDRQMLQTALASLTANNSSLPEPLARWLNEVASDLRTQNMDSTMEELNRALNDMVTVFCQQRIEGRYPFGNGDEVSIDDFGEFFGPNGLMDRFYAERLASMVTQTTEGLKPVEGDRLAERLSPAALEEFRRAQEIRAEFFSAGSAAPQVSADISRAASSAGVDTVVLTVGQETAVSQPGDTFAKSFDWPGTGAGVSVEVYPQAPGRENVLTFERRALGDGQLPSGRTAHRRQPGGGDSCRRGAIGHVSGRVPQQPDGSVLDGRIERVFLPDEPGVGPVPGLALLGKHPVHGDFLRRAWPEDLDTRLMAWIDSCIAALAGTARAEWEALHDHAAPLGFWIGPAVLGQDLTGAMFFSRDRVGRRYPLILAAWGAATIPPVLDPEQELVTALMTRLGAARTASEVARLTEGEVEGSGEASQHSQMIWAGRADGSVRHLLGELREADHASAAAGRSYWWRGGEGPALLLALPGLPGPEALAWMMSRGEAAANDGQPIPQPRPLSLRGGSE